MKKKIIFCNQYEPSVGWEGLKTGVKGGVASRLGGTRFFCSREFFSVILGHFQFLTGSKNADNLWSRPSTLGCPNMELCLRSVEYSINLHYDLVLWRL